MSIARNDSVPVPQAVAMAAMPGLVVNGSSGYSSDFSTGSSYLETPVDGKDSTVSQRPCNSSRVSPASKYATRTTLLAVQKQPARSRLVKSVQPVFVHKRVLALRAESYSEVEVVPFPLRLSRSVDRPESPLSTMPKVSSRDTSNVHRHRLATLQRSNATFNASQAVTAHFLYQDEYMKHELDTCSVIAQHEDDAPDFWIDFSDLPPALPMERSYACCNFEGFNSGRPFSAVSPSSPTSLWLEASAHPEFEDTDFSDFGSKVNDLEDLPPCPRIQRSYATFLLGSANRDTDANHLSGASVETMPLARRAGFTSNLTDAASSRMSSGSSASCFSGWHDNLDDLPPCPQMRRTFQFNSQHPSASEHAVYIQRTSRTQGEALAPNPTDSSLSMRSARAESLRSSSSQWPEDCEALPPCPSLRRSRATFDGLTPPVTYHAVVSFNCTEYSSRPSSICADASLSSCSMRVASLGHLSPCPSMRRTYANSYFETARLANNEDTATWTGGAFTAHLRNRSSSPDLMRHESSLSSHSSSACAWDVDLHALPPCPPIRRTFANL